MFASVELFALPDVLHPLMAHIAPHRIDMSIHSSLPTVQTVAQTVARSVSTSRTAPIAIISHYALMPTQGSARLRQLICISLPYCVVLTGWNLVSHGKVK